MVSCQKKVFQFCDDNFFLFYKKINLDIFINAIYMLQNATKKATKVAQKFLCKTCDYSTCKKCDYDKHILTLKHSNATFKLQNATFLATKVAHNDETTNDVNNAIQLNGPTDNQCATKVAEIICPFCDKLFKHTSSMYRHKKICENKNCVLSNIQENSLIKKPNNDKLIEYLINENKEFKQMMIEMSKNLSVSATNNSFNNTTNSHNKTFNLNVFLNETCKDAMNIMDFVNSMEIELDDLEKVGELGYVNGMTNIILKNLKALDITKRPLHCTDAKREIMYIKDDNKWEKETENKDKIKKALKYIMHKNAKMLNVFKEKYPDCIKSYSKRSDQYNKLVVEVLGGRGDNEPQHNEKIIRKIAKEVTIDKNFAI